MDENKDFEEMSDEERKEIEDQMNEAMNDPDNPDHDFAFAGSIPPSHEFVPGGIIIHKIGDAPQMFDPAQIFGAMFGPRPQKYRDIPIFNDQWLFRIVDLITNEGENKSSFYLEIVPNTQIRRRNNNLDLCEIMDMIQRSQFINFMISMIAPAYVWDLRNIKHIIHDNQEKHYSALEIMVPDAVGEISEWIREVNNGDFDHQESTEFINDGIEAPLMKHEVRKRHLYEPLVVYDISAAFTSFSDCSFEDANIDLMNIFLKIIQPALDDAVATFYDYSVELYEWAMKHNESLHCYFDVGFNKKIFRATIYCSPAVCNIGDGYVHSFTYLGNDEYLIGSEKRSEETILPLDDSFAAMNTFLMNARRSSFTQIFNADIDFLGGQYDKECSFREHANAFIFNAEIFLNGIGRWFSSIANNRVIPCELLKSNNYSDLVVQYWRLKDGPREFKYGNGFTMTIYGLMDINIEKLENYGLSTGYELLEFLYKNDKLDQIFPLPAEMKKKQKLLKMLQMFEVSTDCEFLRIGVCEVIQGSEEIPYSKK